MPTASHSAIQPEIYPLHNPLNRGYDARTLHLKSTLNGRNAWLTNQRRERIPLQIEEMETAFSMGGTMATSRKVRQFFPRNFAQPTLTIRGRMPNTYHYNRLAAFVRDSQVSALSPTRQQSKTNQGTLKPTIFLTVFGSNTTKPHLALNNPLKNGKHKGQHKGWKVEGYIKNCQAGAQANMASPEFTFDFILAYSQQDGTVGLYEDTLSEGTQILSWLEIFNARKGEGLFSPTRGDSSPKKPEKKKDDTDDTKDFFEDILNDAVDFLGDIF